MNLLLLSKKIDVISKYLKRGRIIGFISTAGEVYENPTWVKEDKKQLLELGYNIKDIDITNNSTLETKELINSVDSLYVAGGNVFYLKQQLEIKGLKETILQFINSDKLYIGASAGSCLMSPTLEVYKSLDDLSKADKLENLNGLNIIDYVIIPHYEREKYRERHNKIIDEYNDRYSLLFLKDNEAIRFEERDKFIKIKI